MRILGSEKKSYMFSKILIRLVDQAIIPAFTLLVARIVSVVALSNLLDLPYVVTASGFVFADQEAYLKINSYSLLFMLIIVSLGIGYVLFKSFAFHETHITPKMTAKLFSLRLSSLIQTSFDIYSQGMVWISYVYLMFFVITLMSLFGLIYAWVFLVSLVITLLVSAAFILDIEAEIGDSTDTFDELLDVEEYVLKFNN